MKPTRHTQGEIIKILDESAAGAATVDLCRRHGISQQTFYRWKRRYGGGGESRDQGVRRLSEENSKLKRLLAEKELELHSLKLKLKRRPH